ncbi:MAG TPA: ABC transporter permease, partial [Terracidiphilus sp.]|nr:ABC transporter permease [Terracidiphilus sp.]
MYRSNAGPANRVGETMDWVRSLVIRCASLFQRRKLDAELDYELREHVELAVRDKMRSGMSREAARTAALRDLGGMAQAREAYRIQRGMPFAETIARDARFGLRQLRRNPSFTLTAVLTLAIGVGGVATVYSLVEAVLLRPLPFVDSEGLVRLHEGVLHQFEADLPAPDVISFARDNHAFTQVAGFVAAEYELSGAGQPFQAKAERITASLIPMLGVQPVLGRTFTQKEDDDAAPVALLSYRAWRDRFAGNPKIIGSTIDLDRRPYTVIGVMPRNFEFPLDAGRLSHRDLWVPMSFTPDEKQDETDNFQYQAIARLRPGISMARAQSDVSRMVSAIEAQIPPQFGIHLTSNVKSLQEETIHGARPLLNALLAAACLILLIACTNLANLQLVRAAGRKREFGMRAALGAANANLLGQLLVEGIVLSMMGGALAIGLAVVLIRMAPALLPDSLPRLSEITLHWEMFAVAAAATVATGVLCGLAPALAAMKTDMQSALRESGQGAVQGRSLNKLRGALVAVEAALAMLLLVSAGLLLRSFERMLETDPGFQPAHVLTANLTLPKHAYPTEQQVDALYENVLQQMAALPGVRSAGAATNIPVIGIASDRNFTPEGLAPQGGRNWFSVSNYFVEGDYLEAMRIPLLEGRLFRADDDRPDAPLVAIISQSAAHEYWPGLDPIGRRLRMGGNPDSTRPLITVIGVVADIRQAAIDQAIYPEMYEPVKQGPRQFEAQVQQAIAPHRTLHLVLRTAGDPLALQATLERIVHRLDPLLALSEMHSMQEVVAATETPRRFNTSVLAAFAAIALGLSLLGIHGVLAYSVTERTREIAIRMALGATREAVLFRTLRNALTLAGVG